MRKIYVLFMAAILAFTVASCSKDDNSSTNNPSGGGGGNTTLDVWAKALGTYNGDATTSVGGTTSNMEVTITKLSDTKIRITPAANNTIVKQIDVFVLKNDTSLYFQQGTFNGSFYIIANSTPPQLVLDDKDNNISYFGLKK